MSEEQRGTMSKVDPTKYPALAIVSHPSRTTKTEIDRLRDMYKARYENGILSEHVAQELDARDNEHAKWIESLIVRTIEDEAKDPQDFEWKPVAEAIRRIRFYLTGGVDDD